MKNKRSKLIANQYSSSENRFLKTKIIIGVIIVCCFSYLAWYSYTTQVSNINEADLPLIKASQQPIKVKPESPGGLQIEHKDKEIYDHIAGKKTKKIEKVITNKLKPASHDKIKKIVRKQATNAKKKAIQNDNTRVEPVIIQMPVRAKSPNRKVIVPKNYYVRVAAIKTSNLKTKAWSILKAKHPALKKLSPIVTKAKKNGRVIYFLDAQVGKTKSAASKICRSIANSGGKCKIYSK